MNLKQLLQTNQKYLSILSSAWIKTVQDFFQYWPRTYEDRTKIKNLNEVLLDGTIQTVKGKIVDIKLINLPTWKKLIEFWFEDEKGNKAIAQFWNSKYILQQIKKNQTYIFIGKPKLQYWKLIFNTPEYIPTAEFENSNDSFAVGRIYPIYTEIGGIKSSWFARKIWQNLGKIKDFFQEYYPEEFLQEFWLIDIVSMVKNLHFPDTNDLLKKAKYRLWFDKLLRIQLVSLLGREDYRRWNNKITEDERTKSQTIWNLITGNEEKITEDGVKSELWITDNLKNKAEIKNKELNQIIYNIVGIAQKVYNEYGANLREKFYQKEIVHKIRKIFQNYNIKIEYPIKDNENTIIWKADIVINDEILIELKSVSKIVQNHFKQIRTYLNIWKLKKWILLNFWNTSKLEHFIFTNKKIVCDNTKDCLWYSTPTRTTIRSFLSTLPFTLTTAQKKVIKQIIDDFHKPQPMLRLLQWDVGSGKTIVATTAAYYIIKEFGWQVAFLAPTEILAKQHLKNLAKYLLPLWIKVELLVGSMTKSQKEKIKQKLASWEIDLIVWTHAIIQEDVDFADLQFAIIDEQHRFWVQQRAFFKKFGSPHILQMTATPIPRSLALAFFGEFDVSIIDELPAWRKPITTKIITEEEFVKLKQWILTKINQWQQLYYITPLIEESDKLDEVASATQEYENLQKIFPELKNQIALLHWKLKSKEKDKIMEDFKKWKYKILVSTTVVEVGVDVPQATMIFIKNAERFGLAQLHQLRGRVGRSDLQSYCFLITKSKSWEAYKRLRAMEKTNDWFALAELDLKLRWGGEILWVKQSWAWDIPVEILSNVKFLEKVQQAAKWLLERYPNLEWLPVLKEKVLNQDRNLLV